jgi:2-keto-4-pentenoate hydratase/2-oxohepta-3-ene-1,7-dioic acid hydratase in catechol pathway
MRLCSVRGGEGLFVALRFEDDWIHLTKAMSGALDCFPWAERWPDITIEQILNHTPNLVESLGPFLRDLAVDGRLEQYRIEEPKDLLAPITRPSKIVALGRNYAAHAAEAGYEPPDEPIIFAKAPSSIIGPGEEVIYPDTVTRLDPEIEMAVVVGRRAKDVAEDEAMAFVAGYTILNDMTARNRQMRDIEAGDPWFLTKSYDTFTPLGPYLVMTDEISDPHNLQITLTVNDEVRQDASTSHCIFKTARVISYISSIMTLEPGDVIATGTPGGIAPVQRGDTMRCEIGGLGTLVNRIA